MLCALLALIPAYAAGQPKPSLSPKEPGNRPSGQSQPKAPAPRPLPPTERGTTTVEFAEMPLRLASVGLSVSCPLGVTSQTDSAGRDSKIIMAPEDLSWTLQIKTPRTTDVDATCETVADSTLQSLYESFGIDKHAAAEAMAAGKLVREPRAGERLTVAGYDCARWTIELPSLEGRTPQTRVFASIRCSPGQFIVFDMLTTPPNFKKAKAMMETIIATIKIEDPAKIAADRSAAVNAGLKLFESVGTDTLREIVAAHPERWERRYMPNADGSDANSREIAYRRVKFLWGPRSLLESSSGSASKASGNRVEGFIVQIDARILAKDGSVTDSRSAYFMSPDRDEETWVVTNALRTGKKNEKPSVANETGGRNGQSMIVRTESTGTSPKSTKPAFQGEGYISGVETHLLPYLLMKSGVEAEHGFYSWNSNEGKVVLRRDLLQAIETGNGEKGWKISTQSVEGRKPMEAFFDASGTTLRIEMSDSSIWEPTTYEQLKRIWESKGLPTD
ncbi:MAG: hypothetical protein NTV94_15940 [Planctomycetota bacterium]|nr:hypothetical protein [Planctomycetota bacterium]